VDVLFSASVTFLMYIIILLYLIIPNSNSWLHGIHYVFLPPIL